MNPFVFLSPFPRIYLQLVFNRFWFQKLHRPQILNCSLYYFEGILILLHIFLNFSTHYIRCVFAVSCVCIYFKGCKYPSTVIKRNKQLQIVANGLICVKVIFSFNYWTNHFSCRVFLGINFFQDVFHVSLLIVLWPSLQNYLKFYSSV